MKFLNIPAVKLDAKERIARPVQTLEDVIKCLEIHYECKEASRQLDRDQIRLADCASELSAMAAKYVVSHSKELGVQIVEHRPGIRYGILKTPQWVYILVETTLDKDRPPVYLWCRPYRTNLNAWKEILPERKGKNA